MENQENNKTLTAGQINAGISSAGLVKSLPGNSSLAPGDLLGGTYKIIDFLGQGGMGYVYRVEHQLLAKELALKVLRADQISEIIWRRFQTEAQAIARLDHPNIVKIYDMNQTKDGVPYYAMDLLIGESLADYLDREDTLAVEQALPIFRQICAGLAYAHDRGIIHRDIKPANIMLLKEPSGAIKIVDFGIAKLSFDGERQSLTRPGEIFGSPLYMSPEQCIGSPLDHRTDIYSTGITFFEALTGRAPFIGRSAVETTSMHQFDTAPTLEEVSKGEIEYPRELERIIAKMLEKSPDRRYQSLAQTAKDLLLLERSSMRPLTPNSTNQYIDGPDELDQNELDPDELDQDLSLTERARTLIKPAVAVTLLIVAAGLITCLMLSPQPKSKGGRTVAVNQNEASSMVTDSSSSAIVAQPVPARNYDDETLTYAKQQDSAWAPEIGPNKPLFSKVIGKGANARRHFTLPKDLVLGTIKYGTSNRPVQVAQGTFDLPENEPRELTISQEAATHSAILKRFQDGDFQMIVCQATDGLRDDAINNIGQITSLSELRMGHNEVTNACVPALEKLKNLTFLSAEETNITGEVLAVTAIPQRLSRINFENNQNVSALVKAMRNSQNARYLTLSGSNLSGSDIEVLSTLPKLGKLTINKSNLNDKDLKPLTKLNNLKLLQIHGCRKITAAVIPTMAAIKGLDHLNLSLNHWSDQDKERLCRALPHTVIFDHDKRNWLQNRNKKIEATGQFD